MVDFQLYLITDRHQTAGRELPAVVADALRGGVRAVQLREKDLDDESYLRLARELRLLTRACGARLLLNRRVGFVRSVGADGVHLGADSLPVDEARALLGPDALIGYSSHRVEEACRAALAGADFVTFGPVFATPSKAAYGPPQGLERLSEAVGVLNVPVFALGGISAANLPGVLQAGASGAALISAVLTAPDPAASVRNILKTLHNYAEFSR